MNCSMKAAADEFGVKKTTLVVSIQIYLIVSLYFLDAMSTLN